MGAARSTSYLFIYVIIMMNCCMQQRVNKYAFADFENKRKEHRKVGDKKLKTLTSDRENRKL